MPNKHNADRGLLVINADLALRLRAAESRRLVNTRV
jgi:hypothetical protein